MKEGRDQGFPLPQPVERYGRTRPAHGDGKPAPVSRGQQREGQPQTGGINKPELHPPKRAASTAAAIDQPRTVLHRTWRRVLGGGYMCCGTH